MDNIPDKTMIAESPHPRFNLLENSKEACCASKLGGIPSSTVETHGYDGSSVEAWENTKCHYSHNLILEIPEITPCNVGPFLAWAYTEKDYYRTRTEG